MAKYEVFLRKIEIFRIGEFESDHKEGAILQAEIHWESLSHERQRELHFDSDGGFSATRNNCSSRPKN